MTNKECSIKNIIIVGDGFTIRIVLTYFCGFQCIVIMKGKDRCFAENILKEAIRLVEKTPFNS